MNSAGLPIDLAKQPDFMVGRMQVRPSVRELHTIAGIEVLEPRVMQVLVALALRDGATVSRDELIARCWNNVVVGEDAIQRCIGRLRKCADKLGAFEIVTLSKVGYRLRSLQEPGEEQGPPSAASRRPEQVLAVLPFDNLSGDASFSFVADGVAEEVLRTVSRRSGIRVIGRASSFQFRGADKQVARLGAELGATHVLDGAISRETERLRVVAHLVDVSDNSVIWSDRFEGRIDTLFSLQDEVAGAAVEALKGVLDPRQAGGEPTVETRSLIMKLRGLMNSPAFVQSSGSTDLIDTLETEAGNHAEAWGLAAVGWATMRWTVAAEREPVLRLRARTAAHRALQIDPRCGAAHKALFLLEPPAGRFVETQERLERACADTPEDGEILWAMYLHFLSVGRLRESFQRAEDAYRVDPLRPTNVIAYANALYTAGKPAQALALMQHAADRWPEDPVVFAVSLWTASDAGRTDIVDALLGDRGAARFPDEAQPLLGRAIFAANALARRQPGQLEIALSQLERDICAGRPQFSLIGLCAYLGADLDVLYDRIEHASFAHLREPGGRLAPLDGFAHLFLRVNARLRTSARFAKLCARLGLVDYWRSTGVWPDCADEVSAIYDFREACLDVR